MAMRRAFLLALFPLFLSLLFAAAQEYAVCPPPKPPFYPWPGHGWGGSLTAYETTPELAAKMARYGLEAGWYNRDGLPRWPGPHYGFSTNACPANRIPFLLYRPKRASNPVPLILYFGGTGEHGTNLVDQFRQSTVVAAIRGALRRHCP